jgi:galactokinase
LPGCKNKITAVSGSDYTATCSWRPSNRGSVTLTASAVPTGAGISSSTAPQLNIRVGNRTGAR